MNFIRKVFKAILYVNIFLNGILSAEKKTHYYSEEQRSNIFGISLFPLNGINEQSIKFLSWNFRIQTVIEKKGYFHCTWVRILKRLKVEKKSILKFVNKNDSYLCYSSLNRIYFSFVYILCSYIQCLMLRSISKK